MKDLFQIYLDMAPPNTPECILKFHTNSVSHEAWAHFVDAVGLNLPDIVNWLRYTYQAQFQIGDQCWWIQFPDTESKVSFELTWMSPSHEYVSCSER